MARAAIQHLCWQLREIILRSEHKGREEQWFICLQYGKTECSALCAWGQGLADYREFTF